MILLFCQPLVPKVLWNNHRISLCKDLLYQNQSIDINDSIKNRILDQLKHYLQLNRKLLKDFSNMPLPLDNMLNINTNNLD